jgi:hypothetical protein
VEISSLTKGPEKVFIVVRNDDGSSQAIGTPLEWKCDGTRDGIDVQACQTAAQATGLCAGTAHVSVADQKYFLAQCYGYDTDAVCYAHGTATNSNVVIGDIGVGSSGGAITFQVAAAAAYAGTMASDAVATLNPPLQFVAFRTVASSDTSTVTTNHHVFIRCM